MFFRMHRYVTRTRRDRRPGRRRPRALVVAVAIAGAALTAIAPNSNAATVNGAIEQLAAEGAITRDQANAARSDYLEARKVRRRTKGASRRAMSFQIRTVEQLARAGRLTGDRVRPLFEMLRRNASWFRENGPRPYGADRRFGDSRIIYQYFPGMGWQFHPLSNFAKLNAVWTVKTKPARRALGKYAHELIEWAVNRDGALTWEYYFPFSGSRAPFISSISQGTAVQALARASNALNDETIAQAARQATLAFNTPAPVGLRISLDAGYHFLGYSGNARLRILNMFLQSLDGLHDYAVITNDERAWELYREGLKGARRDTAASDTGAWSLYSVGGAESSLHYHQLVTGFLDKLCGETQEDIFCATRANFSAYTREAPRIADVSVSQRRGKLIVRFRLSKISKVAVSVKRRGRAVATARATVGYGIRRFTLRKPRKKGRYKVVVAAVDLAGNEGSAETGARVR